MTRVDYGLRSLFKEHLPRFDWTPIESGATGGGIPDTNYCYRGVEGWIEMKACDHWRITIRPAQVGWAERRINHGGRVWLAVRRAQFELWLYPGSALRDLTDCRLDELTPTGTWTKGPANWDWVRISRLLVR
jgi:hypothetical protein